MANFDLIIYLILGYLVGSISPGYFFGKIVKKTDIRQIRNRNTGAANTYYTVGPVYGIIAGIFDALKAVFAYLAAVKGLPVIVAGPISPDAAIAVGLAAVAGHIWPFYLGFHGGRGAASLAGMGITVIYYTRSWYALAFIVGSIIYGIVLNEVKFEAPLRKVLKLAGAVFPLGALFLPVSNIIFVLTALLVISAVFDMVRFFVPRFNARYLKFGKVAKIKERRFLSGYTLFLLGAFVVFRFFHPETAIFVMLAFIFADLLAPIGKDVFRLAKFIREKTFGGALIIFTVVLLTGFFLRSLAGLPMPVNTVIIGALAAAILDQFSFILDDNVLVPIGTAVLLTL